MLDKLNLEKTYQYLLITLAFFLPTTVFGTNIVIAIIVILWFSSGNYKSKYQQIVSSKLLIVSIIFYFLHIVGILLTEGLQWGLHILHKMWYFLIFYPILFLMIMFSDSYLLGHFTTLLFIFFSSFLYKNFEKI